MLALSAEQNRSYAIFSIAPKNVADITGFVADMPHKWLVGTWKGEIELSCLMPISDFWPFEPILLKDQKSWLKLGPVDRKDGSRPASFISAQNGHETKAGRFRQIDRPVADEDYSFDPATGFFYGIE